MDAARLLRTARRLAGLSLRELAEMAGTSHATVAAYEAGRVTPRIDTLSRLLDACGVRLEATAAPRPVRDPHRPEPDREFTQVLTLIEAVGERPRADYPAWDAPIFGRVR